MVKVMFSVVSVYRGLGIPVQGPCPSLYRVIPPGGKRKDGIRLKCFLVYAAAATRGTNNLQIIPNFALKDSADQTVLALALWNGFHDIASQLLTGKGGFRLERKRRRFQPVVSDLRVYTTATATRSKKKIAFAIM